MINSSEEFNKHIIAQDDDRDYSESGWVAVVKDDWAALGHYSHCSCYGTWEALTNEYQHEPSWSWTGTPSELLQMAIQTEDPGMKGRIASEEDYDYDHLIEVYRQIKEHFNYKE